MIRRWHIGVVLATAGLFLAIDSLLASVSSVSNGAVYIEIPADVAVQSTGPSDTSPLEIRPDDADAWPTNTASWANATGPAAAAPFSSVAPGQHFRCQPSMRYPLGNTIGTTFHIQNARVSASPYPGESAHVHMHNSHAVQPAFGRCGQWMNWVDYNPNGRLPVIVDETAAGGSRCQNYSGTAIFAVEWGTSSVYHILIDTIFPIFYTLGALNISALPTQVVIMDDSHWTHPEPFYSSVFRTVFGAAPVRTDVISGCFENVVIGFFQHVRLLVAPDTYSIQYVPELQIPIQSLRDHVLDRTRVVPTPADRVLLLHRPPSSKNGRYLLSEDLLERECEQSGVYTCQLVDLAAMSFEDQVQLVRGAAVLVGAEGAAMALTLFGPDGQVVIQVRHPHFLHKYQTALAQYLVNRTNFEWLGTVIRGGVMANPLMLRFLLQEWHALRGASENLSPMGLRDVDVFSNDCESAFVAHIAKRAASRSGQLVFTTGNNYLAWWRHLAAHLKISHRLRQTLFIAMTESECEEMWKAEILCFQERSSWTRGILESNQDLGFYGIPVIVKWLYAQRLVQLGYWTIFTDADVAIMRDPFLLFDSKYDVMGLSDLLETREPCLNHKHGTCQSTGIMVFQPTLATRQFLSNMTARLQATPAIWEQEMFNIVMPQFLGPVRYRLLDDRLAANCRQFRAYATQDGLPRAKKDIVMLHLGFVQSRDKDAIFEQYGVLLKSLVFNAERTRVAQGIDLLLPGQDEHPDALCRPAGIWAFPAAATEAAAQAPPLTNIQE